MKLKIEHVSPYLLCELRIKTNRRLESEQGKPMGHWIGELVELDSRKDIAQPIGLFDEENGQINFELKDITPLLHPLSRLTEEIEHNGKKFVPIDELISLGLKNGIDALYIRSQLIKGISGRHMGIVEYWIMEKLFEWHIDVFGLIDKGLAEAIKSE